MNSTVDINRRVNFVSLDTHPANNALVVTYEISVSVFDRATKRELVKRNKRDQLQINISVLDKLKSVEDLKSDKIAINLQELSSEIVRKCPFLLSDGHNLEDIRLHLLYLINRRQSHLLAKSDGSTSPSRPPSSASMRLRSATNQSRNHRGRHSAGARLRRVANNNFEGELLTSDPDVYSYFHAKERSDLSASGVESDEFANEDFMNQYDEYISNIETSILRELMEKQPHHAILLTQFLQDGISKATKAIEASELESRLEGLYGDDVERLSSMAYLRRLSNENGNLVLMSSNRLLVCAMLRTLRDSDFKDYPLCLSILYCLIRFTSFADIYARICGQVSSEDPTDLTRIVVDLLVSHTNISLASFTQNSGVGSSSKSSASDNNLTFKRQQISRENEHYATNSLLIILTNLLNADEEENIGKLAKQTTQLLQPANGETKKSIQSKSKLVGSLIELLKLNQRHLTRELRLTVASSTRSKNASDRIGCINLLARIVSLINRLSEFKEFVHQMRSQYSAPLTDSLINLLNLLQLSRPGSGAPQTNNSESFCVVGDQETLNELYGLEIDVLKLINNIMLEPRLKRRLIKRNLLKCVLRNLVVFLAARKSFNSLSPFRDSNVLMVPFKCLYQLSCDEQAKSELNKSRIILKCLLEYLLSVTLDLEKILVEKDKRPSGSRITTTTTTTTRRQVDSVSQNGAKTDSRDSSDKVKMAKRAPKEVANGEQVVVVVDPNTVAHYIVCLWVNLSSNREATIYSDNELGDLRDLLFEYIDLASNNLLAYLNSTNELRSTICELNEEHSMIYLHLKLLRNLSQFVSTDNKAFPSKIASTAPTISSLAAATTMTSASLALRWIQRFGEASKVLMSARDLLTPLSVECLAILTNLIGNVSGELEGQSAIGSKMVEEIPMNCIFEQLFLMNAGDFNSENDDLLLVSVIFLGVLAKNCEICDQLQAINVKILEASNYILESRITDHEMISNSLNTLRQLMNHSVFLKAIQENGQKNSLDETENNLDERGRPVDRLVDNLAELMLNVEPTIAKQAVSLLNRLRHLEEQTSIESVIYEKRFAGYNEKWLATIWANRDALTADDETNLTAEINFKSGDDEEELGDGQMLAFDEQFAGHFSNPPSRGPNDNDEARGKSATFDEDGADFDDGDDDVATDDGSLIEAPDLNVIDANSMIKHLTSRRDFRSSWLHQQ